MTVGSAIRTVCCNDATFRAGPGAGGRATRSGCLRLSAMAAT